MKRPVQVIGIGAEGIEGLNRRVCSVLRSANFIAGGRRQFELVADFVARESSMRPENFTITDNLDALLSRISSRTDSEECVVLASGDPLLFGIGRLLIEALGRDEVVVEPSVSSLQLAFARVGISWHDARIGSVHGRPLESTLLPLLGSSKLALLTRDGESPGEIARYFLGRGLDDYDGWVCERLGTDREAIIPASLTEMSERRFDDLNVVVLVRRSSDDHLADDLRDVRFAAPTTGAVLLTHEDVRAVVLRRFRGMPFGPLWDVGAGLGGVTVELSRAFREREVVAIERSSPRIEYLRRNRRSFGAYNVRIVEGEAPACLADEAAPAGVFLGGTGGRLESILDVVVERLVPGGVLVATFIGLENLSSFLGRVRSIGWDEGLAQIQISCGESLAGLTTLVPERAVWIVRAVRPM